jgi:hypothetical protein
MLFSVVPSLDALSVAMMKSTPWSRWKRKLPSMTSASFRTSKVMTKRVLAVFALSSDLLSLGL